MLINRFLLLTVLLLLNNQCYTMLRSTAPVGLKQALFPSMLYPTKPSVLKQTILPYLRQLNTATPQQTLKNNKRTLLAKKIATIGGTMGLTAYALDYFSDHAIREKALTTTRATAHTYHALDKQKISSLFSESVAPETKNKAPKNDTKKITVIPIVDAQSCRQHIKEIIESNKDPHDFRTPAGETLLVAASRFNDTDSIEKLLEYEASQKARAEKIKQEEEKARLEKEKTLAEQKEKEELTELHFCDKTKFEQFIKKITKAGLNANDFKTTDGTTTLEAACHFGALNIVKILIKQGAIIDEKALKAVIKSNQKAIVSFFLRHPNLHLQTNKYGVPTHEPHKLMPDNCYYLNESAQLYNDYYNKKTAEADRQQIIEAKQKQAEEDAKLQQKLDAFCSKQPK